MKTENTENFSEFDKKAEKWYNDNKDEQGTVTINTKTLKPLNDPNCDHEWFHDPLDADNSWAKVFKCKHCPAGILTSK